MLCSPWLAFNLNLKNIFQRVYFPMNSKTQTQEVSQITHFYPNFRCCANPNTSISPRIACWMDGRRRRRGSRTRLMAKWVHRWSGLHESARFGTHFEVFLGSGLGMRSWIHRKSSMSISRAEQGMVSSKRLMTSGWRTPRRPTLFPRTKISAQRPGKKVESKEAGEGTHNKHKSFC